MMRAPVGSYSGRRETAALTREGKGVCVGRPLPGVEVSDAGEAAFRDRQASATP